MSRKSTVDQGEYMTVYLAYRAGVFVNIRNWKLFQTDEVIFLQNFISELKVVSKCSTPYFFDGVPRQYIQPKYGSPRPNMPFNNPEHSDVRQLAASPRREVENVSGFDNVSSDGRCMDE